MIDLVLICIITLGFSLYVIAIFMAIQKHKQHQETLRKKRMEERYKRAKECGYL